MAEIDVLLTDEFVEFSTKIAEIHQQKKDKKAELKKIYAKFQEEIAELDEQARAANEAWEAFKAGGGHVESTSTEDES